MSGKLETPAEKQWILLPKNALPGTARAKKRLAFPYELSD